MKGIKGSGGGPWLIRSPSFGREFVKDSILLKTMFAGLSLSCNTLIQFYLTNLELSIKLPKKYTNKIIKFNKKCTWSMLILSEEIIFFLFFLHLIVSFSLTVQRITYP